MKKRLSLLVDGRIPALQECPFRARCIIAKAGDCKHRGAEHPVQFSCAMARAFDLIQEP